MVALSKPSQNHTYPVNCLLEPEVVIDVGHLSCHSACYKNVDVIQGLATAQTGSWPDRSSWSQVLVEVLQGLNVLS